MVIHARHALLALGLAGIVAACTAKLEESCLGGNCVAPDLLQAPAGTTTASGTGGSGGGGGAGGDDCPIEACDQTTPGPADGVLPCEVEAVLAAKCQRCHQLPFPAADPGPPAVVPPPFPLQKYSDTQAEYGVDPMTMQPTLVWTRMHKAINDNFMPLAPPALTPTELATLNDWLCHCATPAPAGTTCP